MLNLPFFYEDFIVNDKSIDAKLQQYIDDGSIGDMVRRELKRLMEESKGMRDAIESAKTSTKKKYLKKKLKKNNQRIMNVLVALQKLRSEDEAKDAIA